MGERLRTFLREAAGYLPSVILVLVAVGAVALIAIPKGSGFHPIEAAELQMVTPAPYRVGQLVTIRDGVCNNAKEPLQASWIVGFEEQEVARLVARNVIVSPPDGKDPLPRPLQPGCIATTEITGPLPASLPPGKWQLYYTLVVTGPSAGQTQRLTVSSKTFEVLGP